MKRIPFDSIALSAIESELIQWAGAKVQKIIQPSPQTLHLELYGGPRLGESGLFVSIDPQEYRVHLSTLRPHPSPKPGALQQALRARVEGGRLISAVQVDSDRVFALRFSRESDHTLAIEFFGAHSRWVLFDQNQSPVISSKKGPWVFETIQRVVSDLKPSHNVLESPFFKQLAKASVEDLEQRLANRQFDPVICDGFGAYPFSVSSLGYAERKVASFSLALEQVEVVTESVSSVSPAENLVLRLTKAVDSRLRAISNIDKRLSLAAGAGEIQLEADAIMAFGYSRPLSAGPVQAIREDGSEWLIEVDPELSVVENAERLYEKARKSKSSLDELKERRHALSQEAEDIHKLVSTVLANPEASVDRYEKLARSQGWLGPVQSVHGHVIENPFDGRKIKRFRAPSGREILVGENSESNDFLTQKVAHSNDLWFHVRGSTSAHVILRIEAKSAVVPQTDMVYAATLAAKYSSQKHSSLVAVDMTLKKYVRKPKGSSVGTVFYTNEKTFHVDPRS